MTSAVLRRLFSLISLSSMSWSALGVALTAVTVVAIMPAIPMPVRICGLYFFSAFVAPFQTFISGFLVIERMLLSK